MGCKLTVAGPDNVVSLWSSVSVEQCSSILLSPTLLAAGAAVVAALARNALVTETVLKDAGFLSELDILP